MRQRFGSETMPRATTIAALSSGALPSGVAVIRISGPDTRRALERVSGPLPPPREAVLRTIRGRNGDVLDRGLVLFFPAPASFTGEDVGELHCHGSRAVVDAVLDTLWSLDAVGPAEAGDFTRQAFANGKLDLLQVEALGDLLESSTSLQRKLALEGLHGAGRATLEGWRSDLLDVRARIEAELDFSDEDDVGSLDRANTVAPLKCLAAALRDDLESRFEERLREGFRVVLAGPPNSGKSTLLNALLRRDAALVSPIAGTTRDVIEVPVDIGGLPVLLSDTAGLRPDWESNDPVERMGMDRTRAAVESADCVIWLLGDGQSADEEELSFVDTPLIRVRSKSDLRVHTVCGDEGILPVSGTTGAGLDDLVDAVACALSGSRDAAVALTSGRVAINARRKAALADGLRALERALALVSDGCVDLELVAEECRAATASLDAVLGESSPEAVLDRVFSAFCIGK